MILVKFGHCLFKLARQIVFKKRKFSIYKKTFIKFPKCEIILLSDFVMLQKVDNCLTQFMIFKMSRFCQLNSAFFASTKIIVYFENIVKDLEQAEIGKVDKTSKFEKLMSDD